MARMAHARGMVVAVLATGLWAAGHGRVSAQADAAAPRLTLQRLVDPATRVSVQGRLVRPALHALIRFDTLGELFDHIDREAGRWRFDSPAARQAFAEGLMQRGVESRIVSMDTECRSRSC